MKMPVNITERGGQFHASVLGWETLAVVAGTRHEAVIAIQRLLIEAIQRGELELIEVEPLGASGLFGKYKDDPGLTDILEAKRLQREEELKRFSEAEHADRA